MLAPLPGVVRMVFTAKIDGNDVAPRGTDAGASKKAVAPVANPDYAPEILGRR